MTVRLVLRPAASSDIAEAYSWYEMQSPGLGKAFLDSVESTFTRIVDKPLGYPVIIREARRALVPRFPYSVYYRVRGHEARVLGVIHQSRDPRQWQRRVRSR